MDLGLLFVLLMPVAFYFLLVRPQQRRVKERQQLVSSVSSGDRVVTVGGIHGTVVSIDEDTVGLEIDDDVIVTMERISVARRLLEASTGDLGAGTGDLGTGTDDRDTEAVDDAGRIDGDGGTDESTQARARE